MRNDNAYHRALVNQGFRSEPKEHSWQRSFFIKAVLVLFSLMLVSANPIAETEPSNNNEYALISYYNMYVKKIGIEKYSLADWVEFTDEERHNAFYQTYFVTTTGSSGNNGLSEGGAWNIEHVDGTSTLTTGDVVNIKAGNYGKKYLDFTRSGVTYRGYKTTPGDVVTTQFSTYTAFDQVDATDMPLIDGQLDFTTSSLVDVLASNVTIENLQITNGWMAVSTSSSATDLVLRNLIITKMGDQTFPQAPSGAYYVGFGVQFRGDRTLIENSHVENCGAEGLNSKGADDFEIRYTRLAANETRNAMDYYFLISGGSDGGEIHHCEVLRDNAVPHPGHGFDLKDFATNNYIHDIYLQNSTVEMNFIGSNNNLWEDVEIDADFNSEAATVALINGAHHNTLRRFILNDVRDAIRISNYDDGLDDSGGVSDPSRDKVGGGDFNVLEDFIINHAVNIITHNPGTDEDPALMSAEGNVFRRFTAYDVQKMLVTSFPIKDYVFEDWLIHSPNFSGNAFTSISSGEIAGSNKQYSPHFSGPFNYGGSITNFTYTNNRYFNLSGGGSYPSGFSSIGDPLLANAGGEDPSDYVLGTGSPAIGIGTTKANIGADFTGAPTTTPTCSDGIQNQGETGVDCGGPCSPCQTTPPPTATTRTWIAAEWWASLTGLEALQAAEQYLSITVDATGLPTYLNADGAITWAVINGLIASDNVNYLDTRTIVSTIQTAKGTATGPISTTSANDPKIEFYAYSWEPITGGNTTRLNRAVFVGNHNDASTHASELIALGGDRKAVRIARFAMGGVDHSDATNGIHPKDGGNSGSHDVTNNIALPWFDSWITSYSATLTTWATALDNAGAQLDLMILDTEIDPARASHYGTTEYTQVKADARWTALKAELDLYGYDTNTSTPPNAVSTTQQAIWNSVTWNKFNESLNSAYAAVQAIYPNVEWNDYDSRNLTGRHVAWAYHHLRFGYGTLGSVVGQYQAPETYQFSQIYTLPWASYTSTYSDGTFSGIGDGWDGLLSDVTRTRTQIASANIPLMPWIAHQNYHTEWYSNNPANPWWRESLWHMALSGYTKDFIWYNSYGQPNTALQEPAVLEAQLIEMSAVAGYDNARPLSYEPVFYGDDYVITSLDVGGKIVSRVSWDNRTITDPANQIPWPDGVRTFDANGVGALVIQTAGTAISSLKSRRQHSQLIGN